MLDDSSFESSLNKKIRIKVNNGSAAFETAKVLFVQEQWGIEDLLCAASKRLEMVPQAKRMFNSDGERINDIYEIDDDELLFLSTNEQFINPRSSTLASAGGGEPAQFLGGYELGHTLGEGGFGVVKFAQHQITSEKVAMKFIKSSEIENLGDAERTTTEIQCLVSLRHPNITKLLRVFNEVPTAHPFYYYNSALTSCHCPLPEAGADRPRVRAAGGRGPPALPVPPAGHAPPRVRRAPPVPAGR